MKEKKDKRSVLFTVILITVFLISFSVSGYIYIISKNLVYAPYADDMRDLAMRLGEKENRITELEEEVERYKTLYEASLENSETVFAPEKR